jgi:hypothetical protein
MKPNHISNPALFLIIGLNMSRLKIQFLVKLKASTLAVFRMITILMMIVASNAESATSGSFNSPKCIETLPARVEDCFAEFLYKKIQDKDQWLRFIRSHKERIYFNQNLYEYRIHKVRMTREVLLSERTSPNTQPPKETTLAARQGRNAAEVPYLSSGGLLNILTLRWTTNGHYDVTKKVLHEVFKFTRDAQHIVSDASQDPDFYDWLSDAAHAQTPHENGRVKRPEDQKNGSLAITDFSKWLSRLANETKSYCMRDDPKGALFFLGYALHAVQDLAAHNGRTAAQHSWNSYCFKRDCGGQSPKEGDPDEVEAHIELAGKYSEAYLLALLRSSGDSCWDRMKEFKGSSVRPSEKLKMLSFFHHKKLAGWDLSWDEYQKYKLLAPVFAKLPDIGQHQVKWITDLNVIPRYISTISQE